MCVDKSYSGVIQAPPPMDESWWEAVLIDEIAADTSRQDSPQPEPHYHHTIMDEGCGQDWEWARGLFSDDDTIQLPVIGFNRGGLLVEARNLRGFVPVSHLIDLPDHLDEADRNSVLSEFVGKNMDLKIIEFEPERGRLVLSQRAAAAGPGRRIELLNSLQQGMKVTGTVTNITQFGVFVDLGGVEGLIHVSELSWGRVRHPGDVVDCGDKVEVLVLSVDIEQGRVALSLKELLSDPWADVENRYQVDDVVEGKITNVVKFGAFVGIEEGLEGLIHISELGDGSFLHPRSVLTEGEFVRVRIIHIDASERRLGLSIRGISQTGFDEDLIPDNMIQTDAIYDS